MDPFLVFEKYAPQHTSTGLHSWQEGDVKYFDKEFVDLPVWRCEGRLVFGCTLWHAAVTLQ